MKLTPICIFKYQKIQCHNNAADYMLIKEAGRYNTIGAVNRAQIARVTMRCTNSSKLRIKMVMRDLMSYHFEPEYHTIDFTTNLLYPDIAFGSLGYDGVIYQKIDFETIYLHVYENGKKEVAKLHKLVNEGADIFETIFEPDQWDDIENIADAYCDTIR